MANVNRNVDYRVFTEVLYSYYCAAVGMIIVNCFTVRNMGSFILSKCLLLPDCVLHLTCCNVDLELKHFLRWNVFHCIRIYRQDEREYDLVACLDGE
jgi:hypothetical protein